MMTRSDVLAELRDLVATHARADLRTPIDGLLLSRVDARLAEPDHALTEPLLVVMVQGGKHLMLGERAYSYRAGDCLVVTADVPVTGHYFDVGPDAPALGVGFVLRPEPIAGLVLRTPVDRVPRGAVDSSALATGEASLELLDVVLRLVRLVDRPDDAAVLAPLFEQELLWRLLTGPMGPTVRRIGVADGELVHVSRAIGWIRTNYAEQLRIDELARIAGMSGSTLHRHFRAVTQLSPLQFQKRIRLQQARSLLAAHPGDVAGVGHRVGYDSPAQFSREYRRLFGCPPGRDAAQLRAVSDAEPAAFP